MTIRTRFAPSPTGYLHIGGVRTALFNYLLAKQAGGQFILRIDDTDAQRNVQEALQPILNGFRWLGLEWDEGPDVDGPHSPYFQSQRSEYYRDAVKQLLQSGHAYRDYAKTEEMQALREAAEKSKQQFQYDRRWMANSDEQAKAFENEGRVAVVRLKMPREGKCQFHDLVRGDVEFDWAGEPDHVIARADGTCLYHLASVVDDYMFKITHVVRAVEHLPNTPRQIFIAQSLGYPLPIYAHLPYVAEPGGTAKLSKRKLDQYLKQKDFAALNEHGSAIARKLNLATTKEAFNPVVTDFYQSMGFLPAAILNYLLLLGWSLDDSTEHFSLDEAIKVFSLDRVNKSPASFDPQKLVAFQTRWMNELDLKKKAAMVLPYLQQAGLVSVPPPCDIAEKLQLVLKAAGDRVKVAGDILQLDELFVSDETLQYDSAAFAKRIQGDLPAVELLKEFQAELVSAPEFLAVPLEALLKTFLEKKNLKFGQIINALRVAVTGKTTGLGMFDYLEILGRESTLRRIDRAISLVTG